MFSKFIPVIPVTDRGYEDSRNNVTTLLVSINVLLSLPIYGDVFVGNLGKFTDTLSKYGEKFRADHTYTLIIRLRHNVIKTGIRMINMSYSKISLSDIAQKLQLDSPEDAEYIVAKAIRDNVIDATINHEQGIDTILKLVLNDSIMYECMDYLFCMRQRTLNCLLFILRLI